MWIHFEESHSFMYRSRIMRDIEFHVFFRCAFEKPEKKNFEQRS